MGLNRRRFLFGVVAGLGALISGGTQTIAKALSPRTVKTATIAATGAGVRAQVFEVVVRQGLAGAPWREICAGPMVVHRISPEDVEEEIEKRKRLRDHANHNSCVADCLTCVKDRAAESAARLGAEHPGHEGYMKMCPSCNGDWLSGRALRVRDGKFEWVDPPC